MIAMYGEKFDQDWPKYFRKLDNQTKERVAKKLRNILEHPHKRHLKKGARFFVNEIGQYRIIYRIFEQNKTVRFYFIGKHKEYEKWCKQFF